MENSDFLQSWKDISRHLGQDVRTCQRWEKEHHLPVHRITNHSLRAKVFAYKSEIDAWLKEKSGSLRIKKETFFEKKWTSFAFASLFALLSIIFASLYFTQKKEPSSPFKNPSIAVSPVEMLNSTGYDQYMAEGMTGQIINSLVRWNQLQVIPLDVPDNKNSAQDTKIRARELEADYLFNSKMEKSEDKIRIHAELSRIKDDKSMWSEVLESDLPNLYSLQENICSRIHEKLNLTNNDSQFLLSFNGGEDVPYEAFDSYLKGRFLLNRINKEDDPPWKLYHKGKYYLNPSTRESNEIAIKLFSEAIEIDKNYAEAYIGLAQCHTSYANFGWDNDPGWLNAAEEQLEKAQAISPDLPDYFVTLIQVYLIKEVVHNKKELVHNKEIKTLVFELAEKGIEKYPLNAELNSITGYCYLYRFGRKGDEADFQKALEYKEKAFWLNTGAFYNFLFPRLLMLNKKFREARQYCEIAKHSAPPQMAEFVSGEIYYCMGDLDKSKIVFQQIEMPLEYRISAMLHLGMIATQKGEKEEARRIVEQILSLSHEEILGFNDYLRLSSLYMGIGEKESGYKYLKTFFEIDRVKKMRYVYQKFVDIDKNFDKVRGEEEFKKIISKE
jgi:TolB-like protein